MPKDIRTLTSPVDSRVMRRCMNIAENHVADAYGWMSIWVDTTFQLRSRRLLHRAAISVTD